jgi:hypothetical protein
MGTPSSPSSYAFLRHVRDSINPAVTEPDVRETLSGTSRP